ncbi:hypothetical protein Cs7R123_75780 [Catellatospora sp. TT07R-123]|nr:hypothetical protein Cs7R123_75780 [Catellatospora sp. TT07R-123]
MPASLLRRQSSEYELRERKGLGVNGCSMPDRPTWADERTQEWPAMDRLLTQVRRINQRVSWDVSTRSLRLVVQALRADSGSGG